MVSDFGLAKYSAEHKANLSFVGTPAYMAPEVLWGCGYCHCADVYGIGSTLFTLLVGRLPFEARTKTLLWQRIKTEEVQVPKDVPASASAFIQATMRRNPENRLGKDSTSELQVHTFFENVDFDAMLRREVLCPEPDAVPQCCSSTALLEQSPKEIYGQSIWDCRLLQCLRQPVKGWDFSSAEKCAAECASSQLKAQPESMSVCSTYCEDLSILDS